MFAKPAHCGRLQLTGCCGRLLVCGDLTNASCCLLAARVQSAMFQHAIWGYDMFAPFSIPHLLDGVFTFAALEFLSAGLFITTREHGCLLTGLAGWFYCIACRN